MNLKSPTPPQEKKTWDQMSKDEKKAGIFGALALFVILIVIIVAIISSLTSSSKDTSEKQPAIQQQDNKAQIVSDISTKAIASSADDGYCFVEYTEPDESFFASVASMGTAATYYFVKSASEVFASGLCTNYTFVYSTNGESSRGGTSKFSLASFAATPEKFSRYDWVSLSGQSVGESLRQDSMLNIPNNVRSQIDYKDFRYNE